MKVPVKWYDRLIKRKKRTVVKVINKPLTNHIGLSSFDYNGTVEVYLFITPQKDSMIILLKTVPQK